MKRRVWVVVAAVVLSTTALAESEDSARRTRPGLYAGLSFVWAVSDFDLKAAQDACKTSLTGGDSPGFRALGGYRINKFLAAEGAFDYYSNFSLEAPKRDIGSIEAFSFMAGAKVFPFVTEFLTNRAQPYLYGGLGVLWAKLDIGDASEADAEFALRLGAGLDFYLTDNWALNIDAGYLFTPTDLAFGPVPIGASLWPMTIGLQYRF